MTNKIISEGLSAADHFTMIAIESTDSLKQRAYAVNARAIAVCAMVSVLSMLSMLYVLYSVLNVTEVYVTVVVLWIMFCTQQCI